MEQMKAAVIGTGSISPNHLRNTFKRHFGISMREWRKGVFALA